MVTALIVFAKKLGVWLGSKYAGENVTFKQIIQNFA